MNPARQNIYRPSAEALLAAFCASGKRHLIITGARGSGKTTLLRNFLRLQYPEHENSGGCPFPFDLPGFTSWAVRNEGRHAAVPSCIRLYDHCSQQSAVIGLPSQDCEATTRASNSPYPTHNGKRMRAVSDGFLTVGLEALQNALCSSSAVTVLDEIGYLEENIPAFCDAILELFEKKNVVAVLRSQTDRTPGYADPSASDFPAGASDFSPASPAPHDNESARSLVKLLRSRGDVFVFDLSAPLPHIGAVIMASGEGRRFRAGLSGTHAGIPETDSCSDPVFSGKSAGHAAITPQQDREKSDVSFAPAGYKLLAGFCGEPLLAPVLRTASMPLIRSRIAVTRSSEVRNLCQTFDFPCILHDQPLLSDTICIGLQQLCGVSGITAQQNHLTLHCDIPDACLFFQGDQPLVSPVSIEALILAFTNDPQKIYRLASHGTPGSPVLFPRTFFQELMQLPPDRGGNVVIRRHPEAVRLIEAQDGYELLDADTPEDLQALAFR